jgi:drug/metabolite transporter (DMT)-like permease
VIENYNFIFLYGAATLFFVADVLQKKTSLKKNTWHYIKIRSLYTFPLSLLISGFITCFSDIPDAISFLKLVGASTVCSIGLYFYIKAVNHANFSNVGSLSLIGNVFQWLVGWLFFSESISWLDLPAMLLMFGGTLIQLFNNRLSKGAFYVLACSFFWVCGFSLLSMALKNANIYWSIPVMEGTIFFVSLLASHAYREKTIFSSDKYFHPLLLLIAIFIYAGSVLNHFAYLKIPLSSISLLQLSLIPLSFLFSLKLFKEKVSKTEWVSFFLGLAGFTYLHLVRHLFI